MSRNKTPVLARLAWSLATFALGVLLGVGAVSAATDPTLTGCGYQSGIYEFVDTPPAGSAFDGYTATAWSQNSKDLFHDGADVWETVKKAGGVKVIDVEENASTSTADVFHVDLVPNRWGGSTGCDTSYSPDRIAIGVDYTGIGGQWIPDDELRAVSAHEFGHFNGINHVGDDDNVWSPSNIPTMSGLISSLSGIHMLTPDDWTTLKRAILDDGHLTPNADFTQGSDMKGWGNPAGTLSHVSSGGHIGPYAKLSGTNSVARSSGWLWYDNGPKVEARARFRVADENERAGGTVKLQLRVRSLSASGTHQDWDHLSGEPNLNNSTEANTWTIGAQNIYIVPDEDWDLYDTIATWNLSDSWDGASVRIKIINEMVDAQGGTVILHIDAAKVVEIP